MRGKLLFAFLSALFLGSIPACAGEACRKGWCMRFLPVYPRVCGGSQASARWRMCRRGLSPRVRGKPLIFGVLITITRSIPACAGEALFG